MIAQLSKEFETSDGKVILTLNQMDGMKGSLLFLSLVKRFGPAMTGAKGNKLEIISNLCAALDPVEYQHVIGQLLGGAVARFPAQDKVDPEVVAHLGEIFRGKPFEIFKVLMFAMEANYGDFFVIIRDLSKNLAP